LDEVPVEQAPVEQAPVEQAPVESLDEVPVEQAPVEQAPVESLDEALETEQVPVEVTSLDEALETEQVPVEVTSLDEALETEQVPVEVTSLDEALESEQVPVEVTSLDEALETEQAPVETLKVTPIKDGSGATVGYRRTDDGSQVDISGGLRNNANGGIDPFGSLQFTDETATLQVNSDGTLSVAAPITDVLGEGDTLTPKATVGPDGSSVGVDYQNGPFKVGVTTDGQDTKATVGFDTGKPAPRDPSQFTPGDDIDQATEEFIENRDNPSPDASDEPVPGYSLDGSLPPTEPAAADSLDVAPTEQQLFDEAILDASAGDFELDPVSQTAPASSGEDAGSLEQPTELAAPAVGGNETPFLTADLDSTGEESVTPTDVGDAALLDSAFTPNGAPAAGGDETPFLTAALDSTGDESAIPTDVGDATLLDSAFTPNGAPAPDDEILLASNTPDGVVSDTPEGGLVAKLPTPEKWCDSFTEKLGNTTVYSPCQVDNAVAKEEAGLAETKAGCDVLGGFAGVCNYPVSKGSTRTADLKRIGANCKAQDQYTQVTNKGWGTREVKCVTSPTAPWDNK
jgi:hypothetical protein